MKIINSQQTSSVSGGTLADNNDYKIYTLMGSAMGGSIGFSVGSSAWGAAYWLEGGLVGMVLGSAVGYAAGAALYGFGYYTIAASDNMFKPTPPSINSTLIIAA